MWSQHRCKPIAHGFTSVALLLTFAIAFLWNVPIGVQGRAIRERDDCIYGQILVFPAASGSAVMGAVANPDSAGAFGVTPNWSGGDESPLIVSICPAPDGCPNEYQLALVCEYRCFVCYFRAHIIAG